MKIGDLRKIGSLLVNEISGLKNSPDMKTALGVGAGGDRTFFIDRRAEEIILTGLENIGEPLTVISEEAGIMDIRGGGERVVIDPVDGSRNAVSGIPFFSSSIAVASGDTLGDINISYVINLVTGDEFWAEKNGGAFLNGVRMHSQETDEFVLVAFEAQSPLKDLAALNPLMAWAKKARCFGSTALDLAYLALGAVSLFVCPSPSRSFDFAGGWLLVRESGGILTDLGGRDLSTVRLGIQRSTPLLGSGNVRLHEKALTILEAKGKSV